MIYKAWLDNGWLCGDCETNELKPVEVEQKKPIKCNELLPTVLCSLIACAIRLCALEWIDIMYKERKSNMP